MINKIIEFYILLKYDGTFCNNNSVIRLFSAVQYMQFNICNICNCKCKLRLASNSCHKIDMR